MWGGRGGFDARHPACCWRVGVSDPVWDVGLVTGGGRVWCWASNRRLPGAETDIRQESKKSVALRGDMLLRSLAPGSQCPDLALTWGVYRAHAARRGVAQMKLMAFCADLQPQYGLPRMAAPSVWSPRPRNRRFVVSATQVARIPVTDHPDVSASERCP